MDDNDFLALIESTERWLRTVGASELADPRLYTQRDAGSGEYRLIEPRKRLIEMLLAFRRHVKAQDGRTYETALARINARLSKGRVEGAVVMPVGDGAPRAAPIALGDAPQLERIIEELDMLIAWLNTSSTGGLPA